MTQPTMRPSPSLISGIFASLSQPSRRWTLTRLLQSDNPLDIHGELRGTATFTPLPPPSPPSPPAPPSAAAADTTQSDNKNPPSTTDILYHEEGEMPRLPGVSAGMGLRFTKKYIWRLSAAGRISVWFAKVGRENEPDYLFHEFDFLHAEGTRTTESGDGVKEDAGDAGEESFVAPPTPPEVMPSVGAGGDSSVVVTARGNHLCINDMYRTAYAFRVRLDDGEVVSWASRHVVKGPRKNQDIVNLYQMEV